ncbi:MAG: hypothetical protein Q9182_001423 [Xanthomendoza sp. 2 TL-2023]
MAISDAEVPLDALPSDAPRAASCDSSTEPDGVEAMSSISEQHSPTTEDAVPVVLQLQSPTIDSGWSSRFFTLIKSRKVESSLLAIGTFITLAALVLQARSNSLTGASNALTREANAVAEQSYKQQLWDDCHDRDVDAGVAPMLALDPAKVRSEEPLEAKPQTFFDTWKYVLLIACLQFLWCIYCESILQRATAARKCRLKDRPNLKRDKHEEQAAKGKKTSVEEDGLSYVIAYVLPQMLLGFVRSLAHDKKAEQGCYGILCIMIVMYTVFSSRLQRLRNDVQVEEDEEARPPKKTDLDMRKIRNYTRSLVRRLIKSSGRRTAAAAAAPASDSTAKEAESTHATGMILAAWIWIELQTPRARHRRSKIDT